MRKILYLLLLPLVFLVSCRNGAPGGKNSTDDSTGQLPAMDSAGRDSIVKENEAKKAAIEAMESSMIRKEIVLKDVTVNENLRQKWMKMDVYKDSSGQIRRIKLYPHTGISQRSEEYYFDNEGMFFVFISDTGVMTENQDEGKPGKEFHFSEGRLIRYEDNSGDEENMTGPEEQHAYESRLLAESEEIRKIADANP